jgi:hypothetical protein
MKLQKDETDGIVYEFAVLKSLGITIEEVVDKGIGIIERNCDKCEDIIKGYAVWINNENSCLCYECALFEIRKGIEELEELMEDVGKKQMIRDM